MRHWALPLVSATLAVASVLAACSDTPVSKKAPVLPEDDFFVEEEPIVPSDPDTVNPNSFQAGERPASPEPEDAGASDATSAPDARVDGGAGVDASVPPGDAGATSYCAGPLVAGDLQITEFLVSSRAGSGDDGEWVELSSTRTCTLRVGGLVVESPRGTAFDRATLPADAEVPPLGKIVVVGTAAKATSYALPGPSFPFAATDVLKNDGDRMTVRSGATVIDQLDYPAFSNLTAGRSIAFPKNCPANVRSDWARWSLTFSTYAQGTLRGTPGRDNTDVTCY